MSTPIPAVRPHRRLRLVVRALLSLVAAAGIVLGVLASLVLAVITCDDTCGSAAQARHWRYTAQFVLAAVGGVLGLAALATGFTSRRRLTHFLLTAAVVCGAVWVGWVIGGGEF